MDILNNKKPVQCSRELLVAMKMEAKAEASSAKKKIIGVKNKRIGVMK